MSYGGAAPSSAKPEGGMEESRQARLMSGNGSQKEMVDQDEAPITKEQEVEQQKGWVPDMFTNIFGGDSKTVER